MKKESRSRAPKSAPKTSQSEGIGIDLSGLGITALNPMQEAAVTAIGENNSLLLLSPTGSGKTVAFLLPLIKGIDPAVKTTQALIIVPSRELAQQIAEVFRKMRTGHKITACYGGHLRETEENDLIQPPAIIVGTPGRLADHIRRTNIDTSLIATLVLDEFDKSLELGFDEEMEFIIGSLPALKKRVLTSATEAVPVPEFVHFGEPTRLNFLQEGGAPTEKLTIKVAHADEKDKADSLYRLLCYVGGKRVIVFCNHRDAVERTARLIADNGIVATFYHGGMEQQQRDTALTKFRNGTVNVLVTTDLAARGLDIAGIRHIIHYHLPPDAESFTHRNGRTARMEASGTAILLIGPEETVPDYVEDAETMDIPEDVELPKAPEWTTLFIAAGKKDKVNKIDVVGFLSHKGGLKKEDIGIVEVHDFHAFVAIRKSKASHALHLVKNEKIKNKKVMIAVAK